MDYLNALNNQDYLLENKHQELFLKFYEEYHSNFNFFSNNLSAFIFRKISKIKEKFFSDKQEEEEEDEKQEEDKEEKQEEEEELEPSENFKNKIKLEIEQLEKDKYKLFKNEEYDEIIKKLYNLHIKLRNKDISTFKEFFDELKNAVELSEKLFEENLKINVKNFLGITDILFSKELKKETEEKKMRKKNLQMIYLRQKKISKSFFTILKKI